MPSVSSNSNPLSDREFVRQLQETVRNYLASVDGWEAAYQKFYRMPGHVTKVSSDLEQEQRQYIDARKRLERCIPRAQQLCMRYGLRDVWSGLLRVKLGQEAPQVRYHSAIGRGERNALGEVLAELFAAVHSFEEPAEEDGKTPRQEAQRRSLLRRIIDHFY